MYRPQVPRDALGNAPWAPQEQCRCANSAARKGQLALLYTVQEIYLKSMTIVV